MFADNGEMRMAGSPEWKVHDAAGEYKACCKDVADAAFLAERYGKGAHIKHRSWGARPLYTVDDEMVGPDVIAQAVFKRCNELRDRTIAQDKKDNAERVYRQSKQ